MTLPAWPENLKPRANSKSHPTASQSYDESLVWYVQGVRDRLLEMRPQLMSELETRLETMLSESGDRLQKFLDCRTELSDVFLLPLREHSRDVISKAVTDVHCELIDGIPDATPDTDRVFRLPQLIDRVLLEQTAENELPVGRVTVTVPERADAERLSARLNRLDRAISVLPVVTNGISLIQHSPEQPLYQFAEQLTHGAPIYKELADRLHTREDIDWLPLTPPKAKETSKVESAGGQPIEKTAMLKS